MTQENDEGFERSTLHDRSIPAQKELGSGDLQLESAITKLRGSMFRLILEMDQFTAAVKRSREQLEKALPEMDAQPESNQVGDKWED